MVSSYRPGSCRPLARSSKASRPIPIGASSRPEPAIPDAGANLESNTTSPVRSIFFSARTMAPTLAWRVTGRVEVVTRASFRLLP